MTMNYRIHTDTAQARVSVIRLANSCSTAYTTWSSVLTDRHFKPAGNGPVGPRWKHIRIQVRRAAESRPFLAWVLP